MPSTEPSCHFPMNEARALIHAALLRDHSAIDEITDRLAQQGVCRPRADMSRMPEWIANRHPEVTEPEPIVLPPEVAETSIGTQIAMQLRGVFAGAA